MVKNEANLVQFFTGGEILHILLVTRLYYCSHLQALNSASYLLIPSGCRKFPWFIPSLAVHSFEMLLEGTLRSNPANFLEQDQHESARSLGFRKLMKAAARSLF